MTLVIAQGIVAKPCGVGERIVIKGNADADWDIGAAGNLKQFSNQSRSINGVSGCRGDELDIELGAFEQKSHCPYIVDVKANIGI